MAKVIPTTIPKMQKVQGISPNDASSRHTGPRMPTRHFLYKLYDILEALAPAPLSLDAPLGSMNHRPGPLTVGGGWWDLPSPPHVSPAAFFTPTHICLAGDIWRGRSPSLDNGYHGVPQGVAN